MPFCREFSFVAIRRFFGGTFLPKFGVSGHKNPPLQNQFWDQNSWSKFLPEAIKNLRAHLCTKNHGLCMLFGHFCHHHHHRSNLKKIVELRNLWILVDLTSICAGVFNGMKINLVILVEPKRKFCCISSRSFCWNISLYFCLRVPCIFF